jgi:acyl carrier protein phosphodiesterase
LLLLFKIRKTTLNYLAHIFLSGADQQLQIGNFIGDFVKGSHFNDYPNGIRNGIILHRKIDSFTDSHSMVNETVVLLRPTFGRYSAIIADMYFDYFLAVNFRTYSQQKSLYLFSQRFYFFALLNYRHLPHKVKRFIFHFTGTNRLYKYASLNGLRRSLEIMATHKISAIDPEKTIKFLVENREVLECKFHQFFPDLVEYVKTEKQNLLDTKENKIIDSIQY